MKIFLLVVLAIALVVGIVVTIYFVQYKTAPIRGAISMREITVGSGEFRKSAYDHFQQLCAAIQSEEDRIKVFEEGLVVATSEDEKTFIRASLRGMEGGRAENIRQYNLTAQGVATKGQWRNANLPDYININEERTICVYQDRLANP